MQVIKTLQKLLLLLIFVPEILLAFSGLQEEFEKKENHFY